MIFRLKRDGTFVDMPSSLTNELVMTPEASMRRTLSDFFPAHVIDRAKAVISEAIVVGVVQSFEYEVSGENGPQKFEVRFVRRSDGEVLGLVRDITEERATAKEHENLQSQKLQARKLESLGVLAGGIAHEFNNLLTGIIGNASLARMSLAEGTSPEECLVQIETAALRAAELTNQMLAYSGKAFYSIKPTGLSRLVADTIPQLIKSFPDRCKLSTDLSEDLVAVMADASQLRQVIMNLVLNASESLGDGEIVITVATKMTSLSADELARSAVHVAEPSEEYVCLEVRDDGKGMSRELQARIFDPFFTTKFAGRGLGLSAVLGIVRGHEGALLVDSKEGEGTRVRVLLPASVVPEPTEVELDEPQIVFEGGGKILVIDDEELVLDVARQSLERAGFDVVTSAGGHEGVAIFQKAPESFRAVLLDMTLPDMSGKDVYRKLRALRKEAIILLTSGHSEQSATERFSREELAGFIKKPFKPAELLRKFRQALSSPA
jgi:two-component system cell cycle sensor histidine kinase/response regulator CckA